MKKDLSKILLDWYAVNGRNLPWRHKGGAHPDPYRVLVSEFMLQQTTVKTVIPYFERFMQKFPTVYDLAAATQEDVFDYWQGLGYYSRARSLLKTAQIIVYDKKGVFPQQRKDVLELKGIGAYTASSFLALAFNQPETVVDGNVMRVICRMFHLDAPLDEIKDIIEQKAKILTSKTQSADYASAIMDLGALVCTPKKPQCFRCPWQAFCKSKDDVNLEQLPLKKRSEKKEKQAFVYLIKDKTNALFIRKRTEKGLLSGLYELPWSESKDVLYHAKPTKINVSHIFTHFKLILTIAVAKTAKDLPKDGFFVSRQDFSKYPTSTLMKKVFQRIEEEKL